MEKEVFDSLCQSIDSAYEFDLNPLRMVYKIALSKKFEKNEEKVLRNILRIYIDDVIGVRNQIIKELLLDLTFYGQLTSYEEFKNYVHFQYDILKKMEFDIDAQYSYITIDELMGLFEIESNSQLKYKVEVLQNNKGVDFITVLSDYIKLRALIEFKDTSNDIDARNVYKKMDDSLKDIDLEMFLIKYIEETTEFVFKKCFEFLILCKGEIKRTLIKKCIDIYSEKPCALNSIGDFSDYDMIMNIMLSLLVREYENKFVSFKNVRESVNIYLKEVFENNLLVDECNFLSIEFVSELEKILRMNLLYRSKMEKLQVRDSL